MAALSSQISTSSDSFKINAEAMQSAIDGFRTIETKVLQKAESARDKFHQRGQLLPRDRVNLLLDADSDFLELSSLAGYLMHDDKDGSGTGGGLIAGIGFVAGKRCLIVANNSAIKGGTITPAGLEKTLRLQTIARENKLPVITLAESGGANLNYSIDIFVPGARAFANQTRLSAAGIPQITVVHGSATAGGAYQPGLSDYVIAVRGNAKMFLAGPPLLRAATGEIATDEELSGAELHAMESGVADHLAHDDTDGIRIAREIIAALPWAALTARQRDPIDPLFSADELIGVVPSDAKKPYDAREIIARLADGSEFQDFKPDFDTMTVCGVTHISGFACAIIGNNGPITTKGANKPAQFIQLCDQSGVSILFLHNTTGFLVGIEPDVAMLDQLEQGAAQMLDAGSTALFGTARLWDDGLIDPRDTRRLLIALLAICNEGDKRE